MALLHTLCIDIPRRIAGWLLEVPMGIMSWLMEIPKGIISWLMEVPKGILTFAMIDVPKGITHWLMNVLSFVLPKGMVKLPDLSTHPEHPTASHLFMSVCSVILGVTCVAWLLHMKLKNAAVMDVCWGISQAIAACCYAAWGHGWGPRRAAIALMVATTSLRLSLHLARRVIGQPEDPRYANLRRQWSGQNLGSRNFLNRFITNIDLRFLGFFLMSGLLVCALSVPWLVISQNKSVGFGVLERVAIALFAIGFVGEVVADAQLEAFKRNQGVRGETVATIATGVATEGGVSKQRGRNAGAVNKTLRTGLWRYSRHPNYFCELLMWVSYFLMALSSAPKTWGITMAYAPLVMLFCLLRATGVNMTERECLRSKGADYVAYQKQTPMFIPWFPNMRTATA